MTIFEYYLIWFVVSRFIGFVIFGFIFNDNVSVFEDFSQEGGTIVALVILGDVAIALGLVAIAIVGPLFLIYSVPTSIGKFIGNQVDKRTKLNSQIHMKASGQLSESDLEAGRISESK